MRRLYNLTDFIRPCETASVIKMATYNLSLESYLRYGDLENRA